MVIFMTTVDGRNPQESAFFCSVETVVSQIPKVSEDVCGPWVDKWFWRESPKNVQDPFVTCICSIYTLLYTYTTFVLNMDRYWWRKEQSANYAIYMKIMMILILVCSVLLFLGGHQNSIFHASLDEGAGGFNHIFASNLLLAKVCI